MMTEEDYQQHLEFYKWFTTTFETKFTMRSEFHGRVLHGGSIGFNEPIFDMNPLANSSDKKKVTVARSGTSLYFMDRANHSTLWQPYIIPAHNPNNKALPYQKFYRRKQQTLAYRLEAWRSAKAEISQAAGITGDIRQLAQLTLILNYQVPVLS